MHGKKVSVLTVSRRIGWEKLALRCIREQTYKNIEWVVVTEMMYNSAYLQGENTIHLQAPEWKEGAVSNLNGSLNEGLRYCSGDIIVFYQDYIVLDPQTIHKLVQLVDDKTFVTTVTKNPPEKHEDPRYLGVDAVRPCIPEEWEANVAAAPTSAMYALGGFDEDYDFGWSWDNVNLAQRAQMLGYKFLLDETNRPQLLNHDKEDLEPNGEFHEKRMREIRAGKKPVKLDYLV